MNDSNQTRINEIQSQMRIDEIRAALETAKRELENDLETIRSEIQGLQSSADQKAKNLATIQTLIDTDTLLSMLVESIDNHKQDGDTSIISPDIPKKPLSDNELEIYPQIIPGGGLLDMVYLYAYSQPELVIEAMRACREIGFNAAHLAASASELPRFTEVASEIGMYLFVEANDDNGDKVVWEQFIYYDSIIGGSLRDDNSDGGKRISYEAAQALSRQFKAVAGQDMLSMMTEGFDSRGINPHANTYLAAMDVIGAQMYVNNSDVIYVKRWMDQMEAAMRNNSFLRSSVLYMPTLECYRRGKRIVSPAKVLAMSAVMIARGSWAIRGVYAPLDKNGKDQFWKDNNLIKHWKILQIAHDLLEFCTPFLTRCRGHMIDTNHQQIVHTRWQIDGDQLDLIVNMSHVLQIAYLPVVSALGSGRLEPLTVVAQIRYGDGKQSIWLSP